MQEHIRRAHPEHYISKLPATEESFMLMVNTPPQERPPPPPPAVPITSAGPAGGYTGLLPDNDGDWLTQWQVYGASEFNGLPFGDADYTSTAPAATAAAALASLHNYRAEFDWDSEPVRCHPAAALHGAVR
jgi:hypothetical protein